jgi:hypothetical protein
MTEAVASRLKRHPFEPPAALRNAHLMTLAGYLYRRRPQMPGWPGQPRAFQTEPNVKVMAYCHWQWPASRHSTIILLHGLEASANTRYILGIADKAWRAGFNVVRLNARGCGGTESLSPMFYHCGLTSDLHAVVRELIEVDRLPELFLAGVSMGGNQALKLAGELGNHAPSALCGVVAISPPVDLRICAEAFSRPQNRFYEQFHLRAIKSSLLRMQRRYPDLYRLGSLDRIRSLKDFTEFAMPLLGFRDVDEYYAKASARYYLSGIRVPALIIHAKDDPLTPFAPFADPSLITPPSMLLLAPDYGGHAAFYGRRQADGDRFWAENRAIEFCSLLSKGR